MLSTSRNFGCLGPILSTKEERLLKVVEWELEEEEGGEGGRVGSVGGGRQMEKVAEDSART